MSTPNSLEQQTSFLILVLFQSAQSITDLHQGTWYIRSARLTQSGFDSFPLNNLFGTMLRLNHKQSSNIPKPVNTTTNNSLTSDYRSTLHTTGCCKINLSILKLNRVQSRKKNIKNKKTPTGSKFSYLVHLITTLFLVTWFS